jgi:ATP:corrinoid adenosyltransferase
MSSGNHSNYILIARRVAGEERQTTSNRPHPSHPPSALLKKGVVEVGTGNGSKKSTASRYLGYHFKYLLT